MSAVPQPRPTRAPRRRRRHGGALLAALAYGLAGFALYQLVAPSLRDEPAARPAPARAGVPAAQTNGGDVGPRDELALRAVASRVQQSVYTVRVKGAPGGSAFVAWLHQGKLTFLLTARAAVAGGSERVVLTRGRRSTKARVIGLDRTTGLAVLRVNKALDRPLWQRADARAPLRRGGAAIAVPSGKTGAFGQAKLTSAAHALSLDGVSGPGYLGAPVLAGNGQLAGVVVDVSSGGSRLVSLADACRRIRDCG
jgi:S1-C subfamily serine protease